MTSDLSLLSASHGKPGRGAGVILRLKMSSRRHAIAPTTERVVACLSAAGLTEEQRANLTVALSEALSNAVVHGNSGRPGLPVLVVLAIVPGRGALVDVRDFGPGFDVAALLDCREGERVLAPSGRGILLMRHLVDRVEFNPRGNRVRLVVMTRDGERS
jgi:serine/threonine-protein kinase RsbW